MKDFFDLLKCVYAIFGIILITLAMVCIPIWVAVEFNPWWAAAEIVTAPVGMAVLMWGACKIDEW